MFKAFPEFSKLTLADRDEYEALIRGYEPYAQYSFFNLMIWWNAFDHMRIASLNGNVLIHYWRPGSEKDSGLSLVGTNDIDESICEVFDYLRDQNEDIRLVHVPEFTARSIRYPELYDFEEPRNYNEYIIPVSRFYPKENLSTFRQYKVAKFLKYVGDSKKEVRSFDIDNPVNKQILRDLDKLWWRKGTINDFGIVEREGLLNSIQNSSQLGLKCIALYIENKIQAYCVYKPCTDSKYVLITFIRMSYSIPGTLDYMAHAFAGWFSQQGIKYGNLDIDLGLARLRTLKIALGPTNFFRQYTIKPVP